MRVGQPRGYRRRRLRGGEISVVERGCVMVGGGVIQEHVQVAVDDAAIRLRDPIPQVLLEMVKELGLWHEVAQVHQLDSQEIPNPVGREVVLPERDDERLILRAYHVLGCALSSVHQCRGQKNYYLQILQYAQFLLAERSVHGQWYLLQTSWHPIHAAFWPRGPGSRHSVQQQC